MNTQQEILQSDKDDLVRYVMSYYNDMGHGLEKADVVNAVNEYCNEIIERNTHRFTWGYGDSLDRERVFNRLNQNKDG